MPPHTRRDDSTRLRPENPYVLARRLDTLASMLLADGRPGEAQVAANVAAQLRVLEFSNRPALRVV